MKKARTHPVTNHPSQTMHTPGRVGKVSEKMVRREEEKEAGASALLGQMWLLSQRSHLVWAIS